MRHTIDMSWEWDKQEELRRDAKEEEHKLICIKGHEVKALQSGAGWYLGTFGNGEEGEDDYGPRCRISSCYAATKEEAEEFLKCDRQDAMENSYCNGGCGCFNKERR